MFSRAHSQILEDIPKPPSDPAPTAKESQLIEDEAPWRRPTSIRLNRSNQLENPPKTRNDHTHFNQIIHSHKKTEDKNTHTQNSLVSLKLIDFFSSVFYCSFCMHNLATEVPEKESPNALDSEVMLRRTQSFENDEK